MEQLDPTLLAATVAAVVTSAGLVWSIISFLLTQKSLRASSAREQWQARFASAYDLALSSDTRVSATGISLIKTLSEEKWVTDEDKATAVGVLLSLGDVVLEETPGLASDVREDLLNRMTDRTAAAEMAKAAPGSRGRFEIYRDKAGAHRWRLKASTGEVIALGAEGYQNKNDALHAISVVRNDGGKDLGKIIDLD